MSYSAGNEIKTLIRLETRAKAPEQHVIYNIRDTTAPAAEQAAVRLFILPLFCPPAAT